MTNEELQNKACSNSRANPSSDEPGRMGKRLERNIAEALPIFQKYYGGYPVVDVGCGDGLGMKSWTSHFKTVGVEYVSDRVSVAKGHGLTVFHGSVEDVPILLNGEQYNVFCSHTLEHTPDLVKSIQALLQIAANIIYIILPIEFKGRSANKAHLSPIKNLDMITSLIPTTLFTCIKHEYRYNLEAEGVLCFVRNSCMQVR